ncbi:hypothetical protein HQ584_09340, partial [Patescibacteria group bacterium]|nr:hypothetical protein [Patescibacteria group bacterium]
MTDAHSIAKREMAQEKARIHRKKKKEVSFLEQEALRWKSQQEIEQGKKEKKEIQTEERISLQKLPTSFKPEDKNEVESVEWMQYNPWKKEKEKEKEKGRQVSTATIWCFAKRLMAKEWARARGRKIRDPRLYLFEQQATQWKKKKEEEERKKEEDEKKIKHQEKLLDRCLQILGEKLKSKGNITSELVTKSLEDIGEIIVVNWTKDKYDIWIELWEEKRLRNIQRRGR